MANSPGEPALGRRPPGENWGSKIGVILAVAGSAVGLGNFLRFPGLAAKYGGGAFMIPYFISLLLIGIPICWCEWTLGRQGGKHGYHSSPGIFRIVARFPGSQYIGVIGLLIPVVIYMYYVYIESWCLAYAYEYLVGGFQDCYRKPDAYAAHFEKFVGTADNGLVTAGGNYEAVVFLIIVFFINFVLIYRGLTKGIESFCKIAMPLLIVAAIVILVRVLTLGTPNPEKPEYNVNSGLGFMWNPNVPVDYAWRQVSGPEVELADKQKAHPNPTFTAPEVKESTVLAFVVAMEGGMKEMEAEARVTILPAGDGGATEEAEAPTEDTFVSGQEVTLRVDTSAMQDQPLYAVLSDPEIWLMAAGQIFFSLSVGFGIIMTYSSYLRPNDDIALSGLTASATNEFCEVCLGGLITVPAAFIFLGAQPIYEVAGSSLGLGFYTLPVIFDYMPGGQFWGFLWFFLLFLAAITSSLSMLQPAIAFIEEAVGAGRKASVTMLGMLTAIGGLLVVYFSKNLVALDLMDFWVGQVMIFVLATIIVIIFGWVVGVKDGLQEANRGGHLRIPERFFGFIIKYVSPLYLIVIFVMFLKDNAKDYALKIVENTSAMTTMMFMGVLVVFFAIMVHLASLRWKARDEEEIDWEI